MDQPSFVSENHLEFLDDLRESGETNMFGARPYLLEEFPDLSKQQAAEVLKFWMVTFPRRSE